MTTLNINQRYIGKKIFNKISLNGVENCLLKNEYEKLIDEDKPINVLNFGNSLSYLVLKYGDDIHLQKDDYCDNFCIWIPETELEKKARELLYQVKDERIKKELKLLKSFAEENNISIKTLIID